MNGRVATVEVRLKAGSTVHITPVFDAHLDDSLCDIPALKRMAEKRNKLEHHYCIYGGDTFNLVVPPDLRRYRPSGQPRELVGRNDWVNATLDYVGDKIEELGMKPILMIPGNHEDEFEKRYGLDSTSILAHRFGCARGGYSGILDLRLFVRERCFTTFRIAYHHGAWGGRTNKGMAGAWPFFSQIDGFHVAIFGHNHASRVDPEIRKRVRNRELTEYPVYFANCGSWVRSYSEDAHETHYAERHGYLPHPRTCPLIRVTPRLGHNKKRNGILTLEYSVEV
jgi:hypothetical protein